MFQKKSQMTYSELALIIFSMMFVALLIYFSNSFVVSSKNDLETITPQVNYEFPTVYIHTFLMVELSNEDKLKFQKEEKVFYIKDLLKLNDDISKDLLEEYKTKYLKFTSNIDSNSNDIFFYYRAFSKDDITINSNILYIEYDLSFSDLINYDYLLNDKNYAFYLKNEYGNYNVIYFKEYLVYEEYQDYSTYSEDI